MCSAVCLCLLALTVYRHNFAGMRQNNYWIALINNLQDIIGMTVGIQGIYFHNTKSNRLNNNSEAILPYLN